MAISKLQTGSITDDTLTSAKIDDGAVTNAKVNASAGIPISKFATTATQPTISTLSISQKDPDSSSNVTVTGTNFESIPTVIFMNTSTGARITSATVTYTSSTSITAVFPASQTIGIYKVIVENPTGFSVISTATIINSAAPNWVTSASLGSVEEGDTVNIQLLAYDDDSSAVSSYSLQSGSLPSGVTLSGDSTVGALTGTAPQVSADTAYNFTIRATDDESQTTDQAFSLTVADYNIGNSVMFDDSSQDYLNRTPSSAGNLKTWTWSGWVKRSTIDNNQDHILMVNGGNNNSDWFQFRFRNNNLEISLYDTITFISNAVFRDPSAWYHIVLKMDTTQATSTDRVKMYVNGDELSFSSSSYPSQNTEFAVNKTHAHYIGAEAGPGSLFDGYMAEVHFIDGTALTPTSFGETNSNGVWIPKKYSGSYGTNGYALEFDDSSDFGTDTSGNGNDFTANNFATTSASKDTPHLNYATFNYLQRSSTNAVLSEGNTKLSNNTTSNPWQSSYSTIGMNTGKWYWEYKITSINGSIDPSFGIVADSNTQYQDNTYGNLLGQQDSTASSYGISYYGGDGGVYYSYNGGFGQTSSYGGVSVNDIVGVAVDFDNDAIYFHVNGTYVNSGDPTSGASKTGAVVTGFANDQTWFAQAQCYTSSDSIMANFGSPHYSISSGNSDGDGYGNFEYTVPSGYYALNSKNLATYG